MFTRKAKKMVVWGLVAVMVLLDGYARAARENAGKGPDRSGQGKPPAASKPANGASERVSKPVTPARGAPAREASVGAGRAEQRIMKTPVQSSNEPQGRNLSRAINNRPAEGTVSVNTPRVRGEAFSASRPARQNSEKPAFRTQTPRRPAVSTQAPEVVVRKPATRTTTDVSSVAVSLPNRTTTIERTPTISRTEPRQSVSRLAANDRSAVTERHREVLRPGIDSTRSGDTGGRTIERSDRNMTQPIEINRSRGERDRGGTFEPDRRSGETIRPRAYNNDVADQSHLRVIQDRHTAVRLGYRYDGIPRHRPRHIYNRVVWPYYYDRVYYRWGHHSRFVYVYPHYHRKYIFVSLCGYWPIGYTSLRYYRYGYHPYYWYGWDTPAYVVSGDTYNYYTYNYNDAPAGTTNTVSYITPADGIRPVDENTFADVRERMAMEAEQAAQKPADETAADRNFESGVEAFEKGDYAEAAEDFYEAATLEPQDVILPFAYAQALFADGHYETASEVIRSAVEKMEPDKEGLFFPRGLYSDDKELFAQIDTLNNAVEKSGFDADKQFLLGYQLMGIGKYDEATTALEQAMLDYEFSAASGKLVQLVDKIKTEGVQSAEASS